MPILTQKRTPAEYRALLETTITEANRMLKGFSDRWQSDPLDALSKAVQYYQAAATATVFKEALYSLDHGSHVGKDKAALAQYFIEKTTIALQNAMQTPPSDSNVSALLTYQAKNAAQLELYNVLRLVEVPQ